MATVGGGSTSPPGVPDARLLAAAGAALGLGGLLLLVLILGVGIAGGTTITPSTDTSGRACAAAPCAVVGWDPGNIISDQVFFNPTAMSEPQVRAFITTQGADCHTRYCLPNVTVTAPPITGNRYCRQYPGGADLDAAALIVGLAVACGINPQVLLVTLQKESQLLTRTDPTPDSYTAAFGWNCPDTGPNSTADCDPSAAGLVNQAVGVATQFARYRTDPDRYPYRAGRTATIPFNVPGSGCGGAPVTIANTATAALYNYTPYQPNQAAITNYPGSGDRCSSYGNRNFFYLFQQYFGPTGGGTPTVPVPIGVAGTVVTLPAGPDVDPRVAGAVITTPTVAVARGIAAGLALVGTPYVWGGGTDGGPPDQGCARGGGALNSCHGVVGLDCSGLTAYILAQAGYRIPTNSIGQRTAGTDIPRAAGRPGDIIGYPGHVALYLGVVNGASYLLEAPQPGEHIRVRAAYWTNHGGLADPVLHRYWT